MSILSELLLNSHRYYWGTTDGDEVMAANSAEAMIRGRSGCKAVLAWVAGEPAGFATVSVLHPGLSESGTLFMKDLFVAEGARGAGVGRCFIRHLARMAKELGCKRFDWTAEKDNPDAMKFYAALGAERVEEKVYYRLSGEELNRVADASANGS